MWNNYVHLLKHLTSHNSNENISSTSGVTTFHIFSNCVTEQVNSAFYYLNTDIPVRKLYSNTLHQSVRPGSEREM